MDIDAWNSPIIVEFEYDSRRSHELGIISSKPQPEVKTIHPAAPVVAEGESIIGGSYLSAEFTTVRPVEDRKSLIILRFQCHPAIGYRFASAKITVKFTPPHPAMETPPNNPGPRVILHAPRRSYGGCTKEDRRIRWGLSLPIQVGVHSPFNPSATIQPSYEREVTTVVDHALTFTGTARGHPMRTSCVWTVEENKSAATGIPTEFQVAVVLEHAGLFMIELDVQAQIWGSITRSVVRSKRDSGAKGTKRLVKVEDWVSEDSGLNLGPRQDWKSFVEGLTGEVPGSVVVFSEPVVMN